MFQGEELMRGIVQYGRSAVQGFVARSQDVNDALAYLQTERHIEMIRAISFVTTDLSSFERNKAFNFNPCQLLVLDEERQTEPFTLIRCSAWDCLMRAKDVQRMV